ncbi:hypothetical protein BLNAU_3886 [Blattamonas nauphoetae]|uniref:Uncharacterized protein n=1 Tax=Blattamonas nauphoetae TaxID=2049346 RepID=A0ABQ9YBQ8_9EUKA|nr:hypothetical protein BLNAU_3886 [Blattamonas nauphoetae]
MSEQTSLSNKTIVSISIDDDESDIANIALSGENPTESLRSHIQRFTAGDQSLSWTTLMEWFVEAVISAELFRNEHKFAPPLTFENIRIESASTILIDHPSSPHQPSIPGSLSSDISTICQFFLHIHRSLDQQHRLTLPLNPEQHDTIFAHIMVVLVKHFMASGDLKLPDSSPTDHSPYFAECFRQIPKTDDYESDPFIYSNLATSFTRFVLHPQNSSSFVLTDNSFLRGPYYQYSEELMDIVKKIKETHSLKKVKKRYNEWKEWVTMMEAFEKDETRESNISSLLKRLQCDDEEHIVDTLRILQKVASGVYSSFLHRFIDACIGCCGCFECDIVVSTFNKIGKSSPPPTVLTTLARISLFPHLRIAFHSLDALCHVAQGDTPALTLLPSPIFPSSSPHQQYCALSFLAALTKKLRIVFSDFQSYFPTDPSHLPKYAQITKHDPSIIKHSLSFCSCSFLIPTFLLKANPPIEVDSEIIRDLILFVKEALTTILTNISNIDSLVASLPSDSSPSAPLVYGVDTPILTSPQVLRNECEEYVNDTWAFFVGVAGRIPEPHKSSFQTIVLDDPSFTDLILDSLKLNHQGIREFILITISNIVIRFPQMKEQFMKANLVGRMFETVDFVSLPLSESRTLFQLTKFITSMFAPIGNNDEAWFQQYPLIRVSVFEPAKQFVTFIFHNSDKLLLSEKDKTLFEKDLCRIHHHMKNLEVRSDEHDVDFVSELVKWEIRAMVEMEMEWTFKHLLKSLLNRASKWRRNQPERQKRREVRLREEGWDDAFELRVVGMGADTNQEMVDFVEDFRNEQALNADEL